MANTVIQLKKSSTPTAIPASLEFGELAINYADGKLYYKNTNSQIAEISGSGGPSGGDSFGTVNANGILIIADTPGDILTLEAGDNITIVGDAINDKITISAVVPTIDISQPFDQANIARTHANAAFEQANTALTVGQNAFDKANAANVLAYNTGAGANAYTVEVGIASNSYAEYMVSLANTIAIAAFDKANTVSSDADEKANSAVVTANLAYEAANLAYSKANAANVLAFNTGIGANAYTVEVGIAGNSYAENIGAAANAIAGAAFDKANSANVLAFNTGIGANAYTVEVGTASNNYTITVGAAANGWANTISSTRADASNSYADAVGAAGNSYTNIVGAAANNYANATFVKLNNGNQTITGDIEITGNLFVSGNTTTVGAENLVINDPVILLANNNITDIADIGIVAHYANATSEQVHTGLIRDPGTKQWYLFKEYNDHFFYQGGNIDLSGNNFTIDTLNANFVTSNLILGGANAILTIGAAYDKANAANVLAFNTGAGANAYAVTVGAAGNAYARTVGTAGNTYTAAAFTQANTSRNHANVSYSQANTARDHANAAFEKANTSSGGAYFQGNNGDVGQASGLGDIFRVHTNILTANVTIYSGNNALAAGPIEIQAGKSLTIQANARVAIV